MTRFEGAEHEGPSELGYGQTLEALLSLIGRPVLVLFSDEFERGFWRSADQLVVRLGRCAITVLVGGELGTALER